MDESTDESAEPDVTRQLSPGLPPAVRRRLLWGSLLVAGLLSLGLGFLLSRTDSTSDDAQLVVLDDIDPQKAGVPETAADARDLPFATLEDNDGNSVATAELVGQPLIINFWYSTCGPCKRELPAFATVHNELGDRIRFIGVNPLDTAGVNESFARERGVRYELLRDLRDDLTSQLDIVTFPVTVFVDAEGRIVRQTRTLDAETLRSYAAELLP